MLAATVEDAVDEYMNWLAVQQGAAMTRWLTSNITHSRELTIGEFNERARCLFTCRVHTARLDDDNTVVTVPLADVKAAYTALATPLALRWRSAYRGGGVLTCMSAMDLARVIDIADTPTLSALANRANGVLATMPGGMLGAVACYPLSLSAVDTAHTNADTRASMYTAIEDIIKRFVIWLLEGIDLPSVVEILRKRDADAVAIVAAAAPETYYACAVAVADRVSVFMSQFAAAFARSSVLTDARMAPLSSGDAAISQVTALLSAIAHEYIQFRYVDVLFVAECADAVLAYLTTTHPIVYGGLAMDTRAITGRVPPITRTFRFRAVSTAKEESTQLESATMDPRAVSYAWRTITRIAATPVVSACAGNTPASTPGPMAIQLWLAMAWRHFILTHLSPLFAPPTESARDLITRTLTPFIGRRAAIARVVNAASAPAAGSCAAETLHLRDVISQYVVRAFRACRETHSVFLTVPHMHCAATFPFEVLATEVASAVDSLGWRSADDEGPAADESAAAAADAAPRKRVRRRRNCVSDDGTAREFKRRQATINRRVKSVRELSEKESSVDRRVQRASVGDDWVHAHIGEMVFVPAVHANWGPPEQRSVAATLRSAPAIAAAAVAGPASSSPAPRLPDVRPSADGVHVSAMPELCAPITAAACVHYNAMTPGLTAEMVAILGANAFIQPCNGRSLAELAIPRLTLDEFIAVYVYYVNRCQTHARPIAFSETTRGDLRTEMAITLGCSGKRGAIVRVRTDSPLYPLAARLYDRVTIKPLILWTRLMFAADSDILHRAM